MLPFLPTVSLALLQAFSAEAGQPALENADLEGYRVALLDQAFQAASAMPVHPHIKDRSKAQEQVVVTALALDQPARALEYIAGIENWRRGAGYADVAAYCAHHGLQDQVEPHLQLAQAIVDGPWEVTDQAWRRERIMAKIASARWIMGEAEAAQQIASEIDSSEAAQVQAAAARFGSIESFDDEIAALREVAEIGGFERKQIGLKACIELYERFYSDGKRRGKVVVTIENLWDKIPVQVRLETLMEMATISTELGDHQRAVATLDKAQSLYDSIAWSAEFGIPWLGHLARAYAKAGEPDGAVQRVEDALRLFETQEKTILGIDRCDVLLPLAEALAVAGRGDHALEIYRRALELGAANPNARPRAHDLISVCCSLARMDASPGPELTDRIGEILVGLEDPW